MEYEPEKHHRHSIRLKEYDYTLPGAYFVTILSQNRACLFGEVENGEINRSKIGQMVEDCWYSIPNNNNNIELDEFILMPNHMHGIFFINEAPGKGEAFSDINNSQRVLGLENASPLQPRGTQSGSLSAVVQNFKSVSTRRVNQKFFKSGNKIWQRSFYERIVRNDRELNAIRQYILDNPLNWEMDKENPVNI